MEPQYGMRVTIYDRETGEDIVSSNDMLDGTTEDELQITAAGLAYGLAEDFAGYRYGLEDEDD